MCRWRRAPARQVFPVTRAARPVGRVVLIGLVCGVLLDGRRARVRVTWIRYLPRARRRRGADPTRRSATSAAPSHTRRAGRSRTTKRRVTFLSGESGEGPVDSRVPRQRRRTSRSTRVDEEIDELPDRLGSYTSLETFSDRSTAKPATVHVFVADDLRFEQWWIDRGRTDAPRRSVVTSGGRGRARAQQAARRVASRCCDAVPARPARTVGVERPGPLAGPGRSASVRPRT